MGVKLSEWKLKITDTGVFSTMNKITAASDNASARVGGLQSKLSDLGGSLKSAANEVPGLNSVISLATNPYTAIAAGIAAVATAAVDATGRAMNFEQGMSKINTTARLGQSELAGLRNELLDMGGDATSVKLATIPDAFNQIISGVGNTEDALAIMGPALKASQAGFMDMKTSGDAAVNVLGAAGLAASHATEVYDTLTAAVRQGKGESADFASYLPKILPLSQQVGFNYQEIAGSFALMTSKGQTAEQATTLLQNAMSALSKSEILYGSKSKKGLLDSGVAVYDHTGKVRKLADIVDSLAGRMQGMTDKQRQAYLAGIGFDQQAAGAFSILAQNAQQNREMIAGTTNSAGELAQAYERSLSPMDKLTQLGNQYDRLMTKVGYKILPYVNRALEFGLAFVEKIKANSEPISHYFEATLAPVRLLWAGLKGTYNVLNWISEKMGGGTMGNLLQGLFGGSGELWPQVKSFLDKFYQSINVLMGALDDASEGRFKDAANRFTEFQTKLRVDDSMQHYDPAKADKFMQSIGMGFKLPANQVPYAPGYNASALKSLDKPKGTAPGPSSSKLKDGIKGVNESGRSMRNVVVNIGALMKDTKITIGPNVGKSISELEDLIKETIIRAVSGAEQALAS
jgi:TP901 family phage tail tape measure protein